tara:strand:- start:10020 stop:10334 length:315 start_codon:yes stop_codon:yes gene_type:complete
VQKEKRDVKQHLFICGNIKEQGECCGAKNSPQLVAELKKKLKENKLYQEIKVSRSSCLGPCSQGISAVHFPSNELFTHIKADDVDELYELLVNRMALNVDSEDS